MPRPTLWLAIALSTATLMTVPLRAGATVETLFLERGVLADGVASSALDHDRFELDAFSAEPRRFDVRRAGTLAIDQVSGDASSRQDSILLPSALEFTGAAVANGETEGVGANGEFASESSLYLTFRVVRELDIVMSGVARTTFASAGDASVFIALSERQGAVLFSVLVFDGRSEEIDHIATLSPDVDYDLLVEVRASVLVDERLVSGAASAELDLSIVTPEPGSGLLLGWGLALLVECERRRRRVAASQREGSDGT